MNTQVDQYLMQGCMRCKYGGTIDCKVNNWRKELKLLRHIVLETGLTEEIKWGVPVYTNEGKNIVTVNALKESANLGFFKGVLLEDKHAILEQQGSMQSDRLIRFTNSDEIEALQDVLRTYIIEAVALEKSGAKVIFEKNPEPIPNELIEAFGEDVSFETAFNALSPGRQRGYIIYFSRPKQSKTKVRRIENCKQIILRGLGLNDA